MNKRYKWRIRLKPYFPTKRKTSQTTKYLYESSIQNRNTVTANKVKNSNCYAEKSFYFPLNRNNLTEKMINNQRESN